MLQPHEMAGEGYDVEDQAARPMGENLAPARRAGIGQRRLADAEVLRPAGIGEDEQPVAVVIDGILVAVLARRHQAGCAVRSIGVDEVDLAGLVVVRGDDDEPAGLALFDADIEAVVLLLVDQSILLSRGADPVPADEQRPVLVVETHVEQGLAVLRPHQRAARVGDDLGQVEARGQIANAHCVELGALVVDGVGEEAVIRAVGVGAELPVDLALRLLVAVEQHLLGATFARAPVEPGVLAAGDVA